MYDDVPEDMPVIQNDPSVADKQQRPKSHLKLDKSMIANKSGFHAMLLHNHNRLQSKAQMQYLT